LRTLKLGKSEFMDKHKSSAVLLTRPYFNTNN